MRFLIDAQLPPALCGWFEERGFHAEHVTEHLGGQSPDADIARYVVNNSLILVTKDHDFAAHPTAGLSAGLAAMREHHQPRATGRLLDRWAELLGRLQDGERLIEVR